MNTTGVDANAAVPRNAERRANPAIERQVVLMMVVALKIRILFIGHGTAAISGRSREARHTTAIGDIVAANFLDQSSKVGTLQSSHCYYYIIICSAYESHRERYLVL
jgi:hypothetical protein